MKLLEPVLKQALGPEWSSLAPVIQAHYGLAPATDERIQLRGTMDRVFYSRVVSPLIPVAALVGAMVPYRGHNVPVEVVNYSVPGKPGYFWHRIFYFPVKKPYEFRSRMICTGAGELIEYVRYGLGLRLNVSVRNGGLIEKEVGYVWRIGRHSISVPLHVLLGRSYVEEMPISASEYQMQWVITHPVFGETFAYSGRFSLVPEVG